MHRLKRDYPALPIVINGGLGDLDSLLDHLAAGLDGVMLGRAAYHRPALLAEAERAITDPAWAVPEPREIIERLVPYARAQLRRGVRLHSITRHCMGSWPAARGPGPGAGFCPISPPGPERRRRRSFPRYACSIKDWPRKRLDG